MSIALRQRIPDLASQVRAGRDVGVQKLVVVR
jgi:hypothetical protein